MTCSFDAQLNCYRYLLPGPVGFLHGKKKKRKKEKGREGKQKEGAFRNPCLFMCRTGPKGVWFDKGNGVALDLHPMNMVHINES